jgi:hypothetical protein
MAEDSAYIHEREAVASAMAARPDLILLPGDLMQAGGAAQTAALLPEMRVLLAGLPNTSVRNGIMRSATRRSTGVVAA